MVSSAVSALKSLKSIDLTILMLTYNRANMLMQNVENLMKSNYDFELLVLNDASSDNTDVVMNNFSDSRIHYEKNVINKGYAYSLNKGIRLAKYDWIFFCEDDAFIVNPDKFIDILLLEMDDNVIIGTHLRIKDKRIIKRFLYDVKRMIVEPLTHDMIGYNGYDRRHVNFCNNCFAFNKNIIKTRFDEIDYKDNTVRIESDFQIRARKDGALILYNPELVIDHKFYAEGGLSETRSLYKRIENHIIFLHKYYSKWNIYIFILLNFLVHPMNVSTIINAVTSANEKIKKELLN